jgi:hypothetical protein
MKQGGILPLSEDDNIVVGIANLSLNQVQYALFNNVTYEYAITKQKGKAYLTLVSKKGIANKEIYAFDLPDCWQNSRVRFENVFNQNTTPIVVPRVQNITLYSRVDFSFKLQH